MLKKGKERQRGSSPSYSGTKLEWNGYGYAWMNAYNLNLTHIFNYKYSYSLKVVALQVILLNDSSRVSVKFVKTI